MSKVHVYVMVRGTRKGQMDGAYHAVRPRKPMLCCCSRVSSAHALETWHICRSATILLT